MSDRRPPQTRSNTVMAPIVKPPVGTAPAWHGSVNGHCVAVVVVAPTAAAKLAQSG